MRGRQVFFKPYRERINEMYQQHDSIEPGDRYEQEMQKNRNYSPIFNNLKRSYSPSPQRVGSNAYNPRYPQYNIPNTTKKKNKTYYQAKLQRQMHQPIWEHLYNQGRQVQRHIMQAHELQKNKIDIQCTFQPTIRKNSRYVIPSSSNFLQRNEIWQENKIDKIVKEKQEQVVKGLEDCTFRPKINSYYKLKSNKYSYKNMNKSRVHQNCFPSPTKTLKTSKSAVKINNRTSNDFGDRGKKPMARNDVQSDGINRQQVGKIKNLIRNQLKRIEL